MKNQTKHQGKNQIKQRVRLGLYGLHAVREAWQNPKRQIRALYVTNQALIPPAGNIPDRPQPIIIDKKELERMLPPGAVHQGVALDAAPLEDAFIQDIIIKAQSADKTILVVLDQVTDPHNVGAILRSASALGADGVIMQKKHAPALTGVLAKVASGAVEHIPVVLETNLTRALEKLQENGFFVLGLDERGQQDIGDIDPPARAVIVLGAEGQGLRRLISEQCDSLVRLPTFGPIQSLNVSNAAAVALYALSR